MMGLMDLRDNMGDLSSRARAVPPLILRIR